MFDWEIYINIIVAMIRHDGKPKFWTLHELTAGPSGRAI